MHTFALAQISDVPEPFLSSQSHKPFESESLKIFSSHDLVGSSHKNCRITSSHCFASSSHCPSQMKFYILSVTFYAIKWQSWNWKMVTRLESHFSQNDSTRVTINDSRLESESFLQNLWAPDEQVQYVCTQRKWAFFASVMIKIGTNFLFWVSSRAILHFKNLSVPNLHRNRPETMLSLKGQQGTIYRHQSCAWTGFWIFWTRTPAASGRIRIQFS